MSDRISITYDANVDELKRKLDELIGLNDKLAQHAFVAAKAIGTISSSQKDLSGKFKIVTQEITKIDNSTKTFNTTTNKLQQSISVTTNTVNRFDNSIRNSGNTVNKFDESIRNSFNTLSRFGGQVGSVAKNVSGFDGLLSRVASRMAAYFAIESLVNFGKELVNVERRFELLENRVSFVAGATTIGDAIMGRLKNTANELGIGLEELVNGFAGFGIAAKMAGFGATQTEEIFTKVAVSLRAAGANSLQTQRAFYALQQMLSKGVVSAEELRRQLGESLPGASDLMAEAYRRLHPEANITNREFTKLLENGKIISAEILPEFANVLEEEFSPALSGKKNSLDAALTRASNRLLEFKRILSDKEFFKSVINSFDDFVKDVNAVFSNANLSGVEKFYGFLRAGALLTDAEIRDYKSKLIELPFGMGTFGSPLIKARLEGDRIVKESLKAQEKQAEDLAKKEERLNEISKERIGIYSKLSQAGKESYIEQNRASIKNYEDQIAAIKTQASEQNVLLKITDGHRKALGYTKQEWADIVELGDAYAKIGSRWGGKSVQAIKDRVKQEQTSLKEQEKRLVLLKEEELATKAAIKAYKPEGVDAPTGESKAEKASKAAKKAAEEALAAELTLLEKTTEGSVKYYDQLLKVIEAKKSLAKVTKADTPKALELEITKLDKELKAAQKMISSFDPSIPEVIIEPEVSMEPLKELDKEIKQIRQSELELAIVTAKNLVETTEKGTRERANAEQWLALQVAELEKFKVRISTDSEKLKAEKIALINAELKNQLKSINKEIVDDSVASNEKIVELIQKANDLIEKTQLDTYRRRRAIVKQQFEAMANDIKEAMSKTGDFEALVQLAKALSGVEQAGKSAISSLDLNQVGEVINEIGGLYSSVANIQSTLLNNEAIMLKRQLDQKLISEEEYNMKSLQLEKKRFEQEKQVATLEATINAASGIVKAVATGKFWQAALITATLAAQIAAIQSQQFPGFKDGVIDINGPGTGTSDSIPARLSRGESVMTAEETKRYKPVLQAIRDNNFEEFVSKRYIDAMGSQNASSAVGNSFAENLTNSFDLQTAELAHLLKQNRKVAIKNVDEIARAMRRESTSAKVINRRRFR
jgi:tape measure domain-containing protein